MSVRYAQSEALLREAVELFPTGTQTAMKSAAGTCSGDSRYHTPFTVESSTTETLDDELAVIQRLENAIHTHQGQGSHCHP